MTKKARSAYYRAEVKRLMYEGLSSKEIADYLDISVTKVAAIKAWITRVKQSQGDSKTQRINEERQDGVDAIEEENLKGEAQVLDSPPMDLPDGPVKPGMSFVQNGNTAVLNYVGNKIPKSIPELLEWCDVDTEIWKPINPKVNTWTVTMKVRNDDDGELIAKTFANWQVKTSLVRRVPEEVEFPVVQPIKIKGPSKKFIKKQSVSLEADEVKTALIFGDSQVGFRKNQLTNDMQPFHDRACLDVIAQLNEIVQPDVRIYLGDMLDLAPWSDKFKQEDMFYFTTQPSLAELAWWMARFEQVPCEKTYWIEGNHEARLRNSILKHKLEAYSLMKVYKNRAISPDDPAVLSIEGLLDLEAFNVEYLGPYPSGEVWLNSNVRVSHWNTVRARSGKSAAAVVEDARCTEIGGHTHRLESAYKTVHAIRGPITYGAHSLGTTARLDDVVPANGVKNNWQQACAVVHYTESGYFHIVPVSINNGVALYNNTLIQAGNQKELIKRISQDTGFDLNRKK